jgi:hypothetical protein
VTRILSNDADQITVMLTDVGCETSLIGNMAARIINYERRSSEVVSILCYVSRNRLAYLTNVGRGPHVF